MGDKLVEAAEAEAAKKRKLLSDLSACEMAGLEMYEQKLKLPANLPPLLEAMSQEHKATAERWVEYKNKQLRANFAAETLSTYTTIVVISSLHLFNVCISFLVAWRNSRTPKTLKP